MDKLPENTPIYRPKTRGELIDRLRIGHVCEIVADNLEITKTLIYGIAPDVKIKQLIGEECPGWILLTHEEKTPWEPLAKNFSAILKEWLDLKSLPSDKSAFEKMVREHVEGNYSKKDVCVSHDYCDSNQAMIDAWEKTFPRYKLKYENSFHIELTYNAWDLAKQNNFYSDLK